MAAMEPSHSREPKTKRRDGVSIAVKCGGHGGGLLVLGGTLLTAALGAAFAYHHSRANKKTTPTTPAMPPAAHKDFLNGDARMEHQSLIRNEMASAGAPEVESLVPRCVEAASELISEEVADIVEIEQLVEMDGDDGEGIKSSVDEDDDKRGAKGLSLTRHDVVCTGDPAVESSDSDVVEIASEQTSEEELPSLATTDVKEVEMQVDMNIQEDELLSIIGSQGEGSDSSVEAAVWPAKLIDDNCGEIRLAGGDARTELIRHDQVVSAEIFEAASEPISEELPTTDYVKEVEKLVELYLEEGSISPIIGSKREGIDSSIDQSSTQAVWLEELINQEDKSLATESKEKEKAQQYFLPTTSEANNKSSVTKIVEGASRPFIEESPAAVDVKEIEQIIEMNCEEGQIPSTAEPRTEAVWLADLNDEVEKEEPKQYVLSTASQAATEESSLSEIVKAASEPNMEELLATDDVKEIEQQVNMNHREGGILQTIGSQGGITGFGLAIDQSSAASVCPAELISQEDKSLATESPEKEEPQQYVLQNQAASNESYIFELIKGESQLIFEESSFITEVKEIEQIVENQGESKIQSIIGPQEEGTDSSVDEEDERGEVESDGTGSSAVESTAEAIWPLELINEEERRPLITDQSEKENLQETVKLTTSQTICTETVVPAATARKMTMRSYTNGYSRVLVMLLALILVLGLLSVAHGNLLQYNHNLG